ncbi:translation initiation factor eIF-2B epsilon subunit, GEF [Saxophila tyrrhenica]|uniref:Translation initiation factor eIF2B subunit epsilon n=1 Tax=Saxophila tyrrhenica TaxID=1690608 RepID=A0AAV9PA78_9PEZI|nr:translation initiation factor eIF-2B epsilon subunit, GEF [Saxophila tyrrhenica]
MAPKSKKGANAQKSKGGEEEREEPLQAVVFADAFETTFAPFTLERPRCLLPLANTPLIEYTFDFLASAGVEETILYCGNHIEQVEEYFKRSKWTRDTAPFSLEIIRSNARSVGDAMRDLDQKQLITGDFICVYGDVVANVPMEAAIAAHRTRREKDKKSIMTMVLREAGDFHRTKSQNIRPAFVIDPASERCVHYEQVRPRQTPRLDIAEEVLKDHVEVEVREDLIDCGIDICTPEVLAQYTDNFDWQAPRRGFLYGVLKDFETMQLSVHTHITSEGYAARVKNLQAYDAVTRDVISRWAYPLCPDVNMLSDQTYQLQKGNVYKEDGVVLARSSVVNRKSMLGKATSVGGGTVITESVIGRRCVIGKRVKLSGAYIWDDARIGDDTVIERAIVANEAGVGKRCHIKPGALISYGVRVADGTSVMGSSRVTKSKRRRSSGPNEPVKATTDPKIVGEGGEGYELAVDEDEDETLESLVPGDIYNTADAAFSDDSISTLDSEDEEDSLDEDAKRRSSRSESFASINSDESGDTRRRAADFHHEATASIVDALQKNEDADTIQLELQALKLSSNAEDKQVRRTVAVSLMKRIAGLVESGTSPKDAVSKVVPPNKLLIQRCVGTDKEEYSEQVEFLLYMQTDLVHRQQGDKILLFACNVLAHDDLVEAEGFEQWWEDPRSSASEELQDVRRETKQLVDVLVGDDEDEDDEEDEDSE